jgi:hypothetical protein
MVAARQAQQVQQPENQEQNHHYIDHGFDGRIEWNHVIHEPHDDSEDDQYYEDLDEVHKNSYRWGYSQPKIAPVTRPPLTGLPFGIAAKSVIVCPLIT